MDGVVLVSLLARSALGIFLVTRKSSWAKGFGILSLGSVAVSGAAMLALKNKGFDPWTGKVMAGKETNTQRILPVTLALPAKPPALTWDTVPDPGQGKIGRLGVLLQGYSA